MNINILDKTLTRVAVMDTYISLMWCRRYYDIGALDLQVPATKENVSLFREGYFITRDDDATIFRIEVIELDTSNNGSNSLIIGAFDCKKILSQRIIWNQVNFQGTVENFIRKIIQENVISPDDTNRAIDRFVLDPSQGFEDSFEIQAQYDQLDEKIIELCTAYGYGWAVDFDGNFRFRLYKGVDHSITQSENPHVIFSPDFDNLIGSKYNVDSSEYKNAALVGGEGEGTERKTRSIGTATGIERFEMFVDSNVSSNDGGDLVDYYEALVADGINELAEHSTVATFEGQVDSKSYEYRKDYNLGDIVTVMNEYGVKINARIVELTETWDNEGYSIDPVFEYMNDELDGGILTENSEQILTENGEGLVC